MDRDFHVWPNPGMCFLPPSCVFEGLLTYPPLSFFFLRLYKRIHSIILFFIPWTPILLSIEANPNGQAIQRNVLSST